jgi:hypothetical protein
MMLKNLSYKLVTLLVLSQTCFADAARPWQMNLQDPATPIMEGGYNKFPQSHNVFYCCYRCFCFLAYDKMCLSFRRN